MKVEKHGGDDIGERFLLFNSKRDRITTKRHEDRKRGSRNMGVFYKRGDEATNSRKRFKRSSGVERKTINR
jgi:hypothetical protein